MSLKEDTGSTSSRHLQVKGDLLYLSLRFLKSILYQKKDLLQIQSTLLLCISLKIPDVYPETIHTNLHVLMLHFVVMIILIVLFFLLMLFIHFEQSTYFQYDRQYFKSDTF